MTLPPMARLCRGPLAAALAYSCVAAGQGLHHSGFIVNYLELGGKVLLRAPQHSRSAVSTLPEHSLVARVL
jgi:hypothetical protein